MATIKVLIDTPPFVVLLAGCEQCGITSNDLPGEKTAPAVGAWYEYRRS